MSDVFALEQQLEHAKHRIEMRDMAIKLSKNREFKKLILEIFCVEECARYAQSSGDPALDANSRADALAIAQAAGHLRRFLSVVIQMGNSEENSIPGLEEALIEARQEEED